MSDHGRPQGPQPPSHPDTHGSSQPSGHHVPVQPPAPPVAHEHPQVPAPHPPASAGQPAYTPPQRRRGWVGWAVAGALLVVLGCACIAPFALLFSDDWIPSGYGDSVAVIAIDGVIAGTGDYYSGYITPEYLRYQLEEADSDPSVKAVVLRVNSPGGTVAASQELTRYVAEFEKPVVVSIGDVGASGAYMMASHADEIWAMPGSTVGSIGVITEIPNVAGLLDRLGVEFQTITAGRYKGAGSPWRELTDEERAMIQGEIDEVYDQFIGIIAEGRNMERSEAEELATGWAWSGDRAKELGLVDEIGTYQDALDAAAEKGGIEDGMYDVITYDDPYGSFFGSLFRLTYQLERVLSAFEGAQAATGPALPR